MIIDHIGIVVRSLEEGMTQWRELFGYRKNSDIVLNTRQKVRVVFLARKGSIPVKLVEPSEPASPVFPFARRGGGLHHLCFKCEDLRTQIPALEAKGAKFIVPPEPGEAFRNRPIAFFLVNHSLNVELIDTDEKTGWVDLPEDEGRGTGDAPPGGHSA
jgi:methylmalonyl-CoA/ethylmalonyl-CoA epimerase